MTEALPGYNPTALANPYGPVGTATGSPNPNSGMAYTTGPPADLYSGFANAQPQVKQKNGWKWIAIILLITILGVGFIWVRRWQSEPTVDQEPLTVMGIELRNIDADGSYISKDFTTSFSQKDVRYIQFYLTLRNNIYGVKDITGSLDVKYIDPKGDLKHTKDSPSGYTLSKAFTLPSDAKTKLIEHGWGGRGKSIFSPGKWRIEFWWEGRKLAETEFYVSDSSTPRTKSIGRLRAYRSQA